MMEETTTRDMRYDPFFNSTEKHHYNSDYSDILPSVAEDIPPDTKPDIDEKRAIRRFYNIGGAAVILELAVALILTNALVFISSFVIMSVNDMSFSEYMNTNSVAKYINDSAIAPSITLLSYLFSNLLAFFVGMKLIKQKPMSLFKTTGYGWKHLIGYFFIVCFMQVVAVYIVDFISSLMPNADVVGTSDTLFSYASDKSLAVSLMYACIVAPITEELFYRGFVMKAFSRVSQRFGIIMSALFFALGHGNISQFCLTLLMGLFMGYIDIKHNSVIPTIIVHLANNVMVSVRSVVEMYASDVLDMYDIIYSYALIAAAATGLVLLIIFCKRNTFPKATIKQQMRCKNLFLTSPAAIIALIIYAALMFMTTFL